jgi:hypothetical protein
MCASALHFVLILPSVAGCVRSTNQAEFGLGPFGSWKVAIRGSWLAAGQQQPSDTALVSVVQVLFLYYSLEVRLILHSIGLTYV